MFKDTFDRYSWKRGVGVIVIHVRESYWWCTLQSLAGLISRLHQSRYNFVHELKLGYVAFLGLYIFSDTGTVLMHRYWQRWPHIATMPYRFFFVKMESFARQLTGPRPFAGRESDETRLASMFVLRGGFATVEARGLRMLRSLLCRVHTSGVMDAARVKVPSYRCIYRC